MLQGLFFFFHLVVSFLIVVVVLLQRSKGGGLSGAFGGVGAGDAAFGNVGVTTFLHKATIYLGIAFMVTSLTLAYLTAKQSTVGPAGPVGGASETVLPVGDTPVMPEDGAGAVADTTLADDSIVPNDDVVPTSGEIVPVDTTATDAATDTTSGAQDDGGDR